MKQELQPLFVKKMLQLQKGDYASRLQPDKFLLGTGELESPYFSFPFWIPALLAMILLVQSEVVTVNGKDSPQTMRRILQENPDGRVMLLARRYHELASVQEAVQTEETFNH